MEQNYVAPEVSVFEAAVEKGFAVSYDDVEFGGTGDPD